MKGDEDDWTKNKKLRSRQEESCALEGWMVGVGLGLEGLRLPIAATYKLRLAA